MSNERCARLVDAEVKVDSNGAMMHSFDRNIYPSNTEHKQKHLSLSNRKQEAQMCCIGDAGKTL